MKFLQALVFLPMMKQRFPLIIYMGIWAILASNKVFSICKNFIEKVWAKV